MTSDRSIFQRRRFDSLTHSSPSMPFVPQSAKSCSASTSTTSGDPGFSSRVTRSSENLAGKPGGLGSSSRVTGEAMRSEEVQSKPVMPSILSTIGKNSYTVASDEVKSIVESKMAKLDVRRREAPAMAIHQRSAKLNDDGAMFLVHETFDYDIFIRPSYIDVYELLDEKFRGSKFDIRVEGATAALLTGTPGIGKTVFGQVLTKIVANRKKPALIFYSNRSGRIELFWQGKTFGILESAAESLIWDIVWDEQSLCSLFSHELDQLEIWSIGDSRLPIAVDGIIQVCIASPGTQTADEIKRWAKAQYAMQLTFPPCEWDEICHIRTALYRENASVNCPLDELQKRFDVWGGVPRTILLQPEVLDQNHSKFLGLRIRDAIPYLGTFSLDHDRHPSSIFHLFPAFRLSTDDEGKETSKSDRYDAAFAAYWWATTTLERKAWSQFHTERDRRSRIYRDVEQRRTTKR
jgi:hypothetical protein